MAKSSAKPFSDLIKAVNKEPERRTLQYKGETYEYWATPLTMAQRERVRAIQKDPDNQNEFALRLLISKALHKDGKRMFQDAEYVLLKEDWPILELEEAFVKLANGETEPEEDEEGKD